MIEKWALLRIAFCNATVFNMVSWRPALLSVYAVLIAD
jgi:hypothetical protein